MTARLFLVLGVLGLAAQARAQDDHFRVLWGLRVSAFGEADKFDPTADPGFQHDKLHIRPSYGGQFGFGWFGSWIGVDALASIDFLQLDWERPYDSDIQGALIEVAAAPYVHHRLGKLPLDAHGTLTVGAGIPALGSDFGPGPMFGVLAGITYFFAEHYGIELETGVRRTALSLRGSTPQAALAWTQWNVFSLRLVATF